MGPGGHIKPPLWSLTNIKRVAADITRVRPTFCAVRPTFCAVDRHFAWWADILRGAADICLPKTHFFPFLKIFLSVLDFFKGKNKLSLKNSQKIGLVAENLMILFF